MSINDLEKNLKNIDKTLSKRNINLDPKGYFIIKIDLLNKKIIAEHYQNKIDNDGFAVDPKTNKIIKCNSKNDRVINNIFEGRTAKEIGILITEERNDLISKFEHALYLGRELQKAEECILKNICYTQD